ncbi:InlB B-repeat-containing protein [Pelotomaculum propionicicum]|uniref:InlB B-repeat-containing protein n=1 Tax=Pelotomaculum propionicicum TaxID=258475 RepID=UPI003B811B34
MSWPTDADGFLFGDEGISATYGGPGDLWGLTSWNVADILDPDFGAALSVVINATADNAVAGVDSMKIKVYYTVEGQITPTLLVTNSPVAYNGSPQAAAVSGSVDGVVSDIKYDGSSDMPTSAGTYAVTADFTPTDTTNYASLDDASAGSFVVSQTAPVLSVTNSPVTYNGSQQAAEVSGSVAGVVSDIKYDGSFTVPTAAGTYAVTADFTPTDTTNYASSDDASAGSFIINQATPVLSVTNSPVTYNGSPQAAAVSGSVDGVVSDVKYNGSSTVPTDAGTYAVTGDFTPNDTVNYTSLDDASAGTFTINQLTVTHTVTVTVAADSTAGGWVSGEGTFEEGAIVTVTATVNAGYSFVNWTENDAEVSTSAVYEFIMGTADRTLVAHFALIPTYNVSVSASPAEGGSVSGGGSYAEGARVTVTAAANPGYSFVNWTEGSNAVSTKATYRFTMGTADRNLTANFQAAAPGWPKGIRLSATAVTSNSVTLTLNQPVPEAVEYIVYYGEQSKTFSAGAGTTFVIDGLSKGTSYTFTVQAGYAGDIETTNGPSKKVRTK